jgi:hypothetical protein
VTEVSDLHFEKRLSSKTSTDAGRVISTKSVSLNAYPSIRNNLDHDSNVTEDSDLHKEKYLETKTSTDEGRMISIKPVIMNACLSIRDNLDHDSNVTEERNMPIRTAPVNQDLNR